MNNKEVQKTFLELETFTAKPEASEHPHKL